MVNIWNIFSQNNLALKKLYTIFAECIDHFYGNTCRSVCGLCKDYKACDKHTGVCQNGCMDHVVGEKCNSK